jgi:ABC-2 type transport system permease protein
MKNNIRLTLIIAKYSFLEILKSKILYTLLVICIGILLSTFVAMEFTYGSVTRVSINVGLGLTSVFNLFISIFLGVNLISNEIENRTLYMVISKPISRSVFLIGKTSGLLLLMFLNILFFSFFSSAIYFLVGGEFNSIIPLSFLFIFIESSIVLLLTVLFSIVSSKVITISMAIMIYFSAHSISSLKGLSFVKENDALSLVLKGLEKIFPPFAALNIKDYVLIKQHLPSDFIFYALSSSIIYSLIILMLTNLIFINRDLT